MVMAGAFSDLMVAPVASIVKSTLEIISRLRRAAATSADSDNGVSLINSDHNLLDVWAALLPSQAVSGLVLDGGI